MSNRIIDILFGIAIILIMASSLSIGQQFQISAKTGALYYSDWPTYEKRVSYIADIALLPESGASFHFLVSYANIHTYSKHKTLTEQRTKTKTIGLNPGIKLFNFLLFGYGCNFQYKDAHVWSQISQETTYLSHRYETEWWPFLALDVDIYIYEEFYFSFGGYVMVPEVNLAVGLSKRF